MPQPLIHLPNTLRNWPWPRAINLHYEECKRESEAWIESFQAFSPKAQRAFNKCNFSLLSSLAWANLNRGSATPPFPLFSLLGI